MASSQQVSVMQAVSGIRTTLVNATLHHRKQEGPHGKLSCTGLNRKQFWSRARRVQPVLQSSSFCRRIFAWRNHIHQCDEIIG